MKSILLVEDDNFLVDIYKEKLKEAGFNIDVAFDGEEAVRRINEYRLPNFENQTFWPDLILLDMVLSHGDGWEILKKIKEWGGLEKTKVIILSNLGQKEDVKKGLEMGAVKYLVKAHYTPSQVVEEINKIF